MKRKNFYLLVLFLLLVVGTVYISYSERTTPFQKDSGKVFGTFYHITYQNDENLNKEILEELAKVDASLSMFNEKSTIAAVNRGEDVTVDGLFEEVYKLAEGISRDTDGAFDITVAPLVNAWGFGFKEGTEPTKQTIDSIMATIGYEKVQLERNKIKKENPATMLDCSAIAKGFGCDIVARLFNKLGIENYMIEIGGEVIVKGHNEKRAKWKVGIAKPNEDATSENNELQEVIAITDKALATSGNYRNFYYKGGKRYAHTIDPKTGYPVQHNILSATVFASSCAKADAYATSFMVMGLDRAKEILARHNGMKAYIIYDDNGKMKLWSSKGLLKE